MDNERILEHLIRIENALTKNQNDIQHYFDRTRKLEEEMVKVQKMVSFGEVSFKIITLVAALGTVIKVFTTLG